LWRARHQLAERLGRRLRRMKDDMTGAMGSRVQLLLRDEVKEVKDVKDVKGKEGRRKRWPFLLMQLRKDS